ncbi:nitrate/nitrite transporter [Mycolicibacterium sp.]|uniref:nitrate/nitrite transporter n=1 Tax=Mycolicibacterium sp. TaxID=2320850 RepID=UPI0037CBF591
MAWLVWTVGVIAYILTVMQRTTLAAAGLDAADRFGLNPGTLATFVFIQVAVFAIAQIPAGLLVDRYGPRAMLVANAALLAGGQFLLATATTMPIAIVARVLVGTGDAIVFAATLALIPRWFAARRVPLMTQLTTIMGQLGQILSAVPFVALLRHTGWSAAFLSVGAASALVGVLAFAVVRNGPPGTWVPTPIASVGDVGAALKQVWSRPGTRLGFFGHMATQFPVTVFALLWGFPYLISAQHLSESTASMLIMVLVVSTVAIGPVIGVLTARHPLHRSWLIFGIMAPAVAVWTLVLALPGPAPLWLLIVLVVTLAAGGPGSVVGLDIARTSNPRLNIGVAQGIANLGGFTATLFVLAAMGAVMTIAGGFTPEAFRLSWLVMYPVWALAVLGIIVTRRKARRLDAENGIVPRPLRQVLAEVTNR